MSYNHTSYDGSSRPPYRRPDDWNAPQTYNAEYDYDRDGRGQQDEPSYSSGNEYWREGQDYAYSSRPYEQDFDYRGGDYYRSNQGTGSYGQYHGQPSSAPYHAGGSYHPVIPQQQSYVPSHIRQPTAALPPFPPTLPGNPGQTRSYSTQRESPKPAYKRDKTPPPPPLQFPPAEYLELSRPAQKMKSDDVVPKLLVLDLNGALVFRNRSSDGRKSYPRPYLQSFLEYLFHPELNSTGSRPWEVFVWSSAQPHNVRGMVEGAFGLPWVEGVWDEETARGKAAREEGQGRLLGVWARDKMGLAAADYSRRVQTTKDLRKVIDHLRHPDPDSRIPPMEYDERTVVLLDDSPLKAVYQPFNQLVIPEYDKKEYQEAKAAAATLAPGTIGYSFLPGMDETLLAVVGILDELKEINNVPAWIRSGGLTLVEEYKEELQLEALPSHEDYVHWFKDARIFGYWVEMGKQALERKGIEIRHGIDPEPSSVSSKNRSPYRPNHSKQSPSLPRRSRSPSSPTGRGYATRSAVKVDDDELPDDDVVESQRSESQNVRPIDVARYIDEIIDRTANLTITQRDQLRSARAILSGLPTSPLSMSRLPSSKDNDDGIAENAQEDEQDLTRTSATGRKSRWPAEFAAAKASQPKLTKKGFKAQRKAGRQNHLNETKTIREEQLHRDLESHKARKLNDLARQKTLQLNTAGVAGQRSDAADASVAETSVEDEEGGEEEGGEEEGGEEEGGEEEGGSVDEKERTKMVWMSG